MNVSVYENLKAFLKVPLLLEVEWSCSDLHSVKFPLEETLLVPCHWPMYAVSVDDFVLPCHFEFYAIGFIMDIIDTTDSGDSAAFYYFVS